jgi:hypothetical protein
VIGKRPDSAETYLKLASAYRSKEDEAMARELLSKIG